MIGTGILQRGGDGERIQTCMSSEGGSVVVPVIPQQAGGDGEDPVVLPSVSQAQAMSSDADVHVFEPEVLLHERDCSDELLLSGVQAILNRDSFSDGNNSADAAPAGDGEVGSTAEKGDGNTSGINPRDTRKASALTGTTVPHSEPVASESSFLGISCDPASYCNLGYLEPEISNYIRAMGPSQPQKSDLSGGFPKDKDNRCFHEAWFWRTLPGGDKTRRSWMSYSAAKDRVFCMDCMLFGDKSKVSGAWTRDGFRTWATGTTSIIAHETSVCHVEASLKARLRDAPVAHVDSSMEEGRRTKIAENREIVKQLTDVVLYLGRHNIAFRGHREKSTETIRGNYIDLVYLLAKYSPQMASYLNSLEAIKSRKTSSFLTWENQNHLINAIGQVIKDKIKKNLEAARFFSLSMDTTFDLSRKEQVAIVCRYVDENTGKVCERLIAIRECSSTKGASMFKIFQEVCEEYKLNWKELLVGQSYDGASNMSGDFNGLKAHILNQNSAAIFVWCCAHRLNLVVAEAAMSCINARDLFSIFENMFVFVCSSKGKVKLFEDNQKQMYPKEPVRRLKRVKTTRWMSHASAREVGVQKFDALAQTLTDITPIPLRVLNPADPTDKVTSAERAAATEASGYLKYILSERFVLTALMFTKVFNIIGPINKILQGVDIDLIVASGNIQKAISDLKKLRCDEAFKSLLEEKSKFIASKLNFEFEPLPNPPKRRRKLMAGELARDDPVDDPVAKFRVETYYGCLDSIINQLDERFGDLTNGLFCDLALFTDRRILEVNGKPEALPKASFQYFCKVYGKFVNENQLTKEYVSFSKVYPEFKKTVKLPEKLHSHWEDELNEQRDRDKSDDEKSEEAASSVDEVDNPVPVTEKDAPSNSGSLSAVLEIMRTAGLKAVFPTLYTAIKIAVTIPVSSVTPERRFSKLGLVKNKLRTTMGSSRLEDLMLISCERDIIIDYDAVIAMFARKSRVLSKLLLY